MSNLAFIPLGIVYITKETSYDPLDAIFEKLKNRVFLSNLAFISLESVYITKETSYRILNIIFEKSIFYDQNEILSAKKDHNDVL